MPKFTIPMKVFMLDKLKLIIISGFCFSSIIFFASLSLSTEQTNKTNERKEQTNSLQWIDGLSLLILSITAVTGLWELNTLNKQLKSNHEWNRRQLSQDLLFKIVTGDIVKIREKFKQEFKADLNSKTEKYEHISSSLSPEKKEDLDITLITLFNYFEAIAIGIKNHTLDDEICYQYLGFIVVNTWKWALTFIQHKRNHVDKVIWIDFTNLATKWERQLEEDENRIARSGKSPTG